jgi:hypothetical protein
VQWLVQWYQCKAVTSSTAQCCSWSMRALLYVKNMNGDVRIVGQDVIGDRRQSCVRTHTVLGSETFRLEVIVCSFGKKLEDVITLP